MRKALIAAAAAATLAGLSPPAVAQPAIDRSDARCLLVLQAVAQDPKQKEAAGRGIFFYLGRVAARGPISRLQATLLAEARAIQNQQQAQAELARCGSELNQTTTQFQAVTKNLAATAPRPAAPPPKAK